MSQENTCITFRLCWNGVDRLFVTQLTIHDFMNEQKPSNFQFMNL